MGDVVVVVVLAILVFLGGFVVLGMMAWKTLQRVKALGRVVAAASDRIGDATAALDAVAPRPPAYTRTGPPAETKDSI